MFSAVSPSRRLAVSPCHAHKNGSSFISAEYFDEAARLGNLPCNSIVAQIGAQEGSFMIGW